MLTKAINTDCVEFMKTLPDNYFDMGNCDPPYGIKEDSKANKSRGGLVSQKNGTTTMVEASDFGDESWDNQPPSQEYFDQLFRVCRYIILWGANYYEFDQKSSSTGRILWDKVRRTDKAMGDGEIAWTNLTTSIRVITYMWNGFNQGVSVKRGRIAQGDKSKNEKRLQNGHKPVKLYQGIADRWYKPGWKIFDSHLGSGSHRIACEERGFEFIGTEISPKRFKQSQDWYDKVFDTGQMKMFG